MEVKTEKSLECSVCEQKEANCVTLPCGHMTTCVSCVETERRCRVCKAGRSAFIEVFLS